MKIEKACEGAEYRESWGVIWDDDGASFPNSSSGIFHQRHTERRALAVMLDSVNIGNSLTARMYVSHVSWGETKLRSLQPRRSVMSISWWRTKEKVGGLADLGKSCRFSSQEKYEIRETKVHTHTALPVNTAGLSLKKQGDKHRVFPHRPWLPFLLTEWKQRGSLKKGVWEGENYRSLCHCLLMSWKTGRPHGISWDGSANSDIETWH